ncbi:MAG: endonuclease V [Desulfurobacteriaceae bacterium]
MAFSEDGHLKFSLDKAKKAQAILREKVNLKPLNLENVKFIAGCDLTFTNPYRTPTLGIGAFVVFSYPDLKVVEKVFEVSEVKISYFPGFLAFREVPVLLKAYKKLKIKPDIVIVDGHGIAHPRRLGIATHLGVVLKIPTIGCAKKPLYGVFKNPCEKAGCFEPILDPKTKENIGFVLRTKNKVKPVFISPGNLITLKDSLKVIKSVCRGYRIPEPTRLSHNYLQEVRKMYNSR